VSAPPPKEYIGDGVSGTVVSATDPGERARRSILACCGDCAPDDLCERCKAMVPPWWMDHANLAELHRYLTGSDCPEADALDPSQVQYFLEKPWKWMQEWERMRKTRS
jgi:hypothetical protein